VLGSLEVTVMVRRDVRDEVSGLIRADEALADAEGRHVAIVGAMVSRPYDVAVPLGILQARMTSSRLPGKVLEPIEGEPMIGRQIERLRRSSALVGLVVATSVDPSDDPLVAYVESLDVPVVRGSLDDVLGRFISVLDEFMPEAVVRLTADCPLASPTVLDRVASSFLTSDVDYASNTLEPTWPDGVDVEVVRSDALRWVAANSSDPHEYKHVTLGVYRRPDRFRCLNVAGDVDLSSLRWTVDNAEDLAFVRSVYASLFPARPDFDVADVLDFVREHPELSRTSAEAARNAALDGLDTGVMKR